MTQTSLNSIKTLFTAKNQREEEDLANYSEEELKKQISYPLHTKKDSKSSLKENATVDYIEIHTAENTSIIIPCDFDEVSELSSDSYESRNISNNNYEEVKL